MIQLIQKVSCCHTWKFALLVIAILSDFICYNMAYQQSSLAIVGESVRMDCRVGGPVEWVFVGMTSNELVRIATNGLVSDSLGLKYEVATDHDQNNYLKVNGVGHRDEGLYTCTNADKADWKDSINLFVFNGTSGVEVRREGALVGDTVILNCSTKSSPYPVDWTRRHYPFSRPERICSNGQITRGFTDKFTLLRPTENEYNLVIKDVQLSDIGAYICIEEGGIGSRSVIAHLGVYESRHSPNVTACVGDDVVLSCRTNIPRPVWTAACQAGSLHKVAPSCRHSFTKLDTDTVRLEISNVQPFDSGEYTCSLGRSSNVVNGTLLVVQHCSVQSDTDARCSLREKAAADAVLTMTMIILAAMIGVIILTAVLTIVQRRRLKHKTCDAGRDLRTGVLFSMSESTSTDRMLLSSDTYSSQCEQGKTIHKQQKEAVLLAASETTAERTHDENLDAETDKSGMCTGNDRQDLVVELTEEVNVLMKEVEQQNLREKLRKHFIALMENEQQLKAENATLRQKTSEAKSNLSKGGVDSKTQKELDESCYECSKLNADEELVKLRWSLRQVQEELQFRRANATATKIRYLKEMSTLSPGSRKCLGQLIIDSQRANSANKPEHDQSILRQYDWLMKNICPLAKSLATDMFSNDSLTVNEMESIQCCQSETKAAKKLLDVVRNQATCTFDSFLNALRNAGQDHAYVQLVYEGKLSADVMRDYNIFPIDSIDVRFSGLLDRLLDAGVIEESEKREIEHEKTIAQDNVKLLSIMIGKSVDHFRLFMAALNETGQSHVADKIHPRDRQYVRLSRRV